MLRPGALIANGTRIASAGPCVCSVDGEVAGRAPPGERRSAPAQPPRGAGRHRGAAPAAGRRGRRRPHPRPRLGDRAGRPRAPRRPPPRRRHGGAGATRCGPPSPSSRSARTCCSTSSRPERPGPVGRPGSRPASTGHRGPLANRPGGPDAPPCLDGPVGLRVLIAEDEAIIRLDLRETLEEEGYEVVGETGRGDEAVAMARELRAGPGRARHRDAGDGRPGGGPADGGRAAVRRAHPHRLQPARAHRAGPRRRRAGLPGQAVPEERPGARAGAGATPAIASCRRSAARSARWRSASSRAS